MGRKPRIPCVLQDAWWEIWMGTLRCAKGQANWKHWKLVAGTPRVSRLVRCSWKEPPLYNYSTAAAISLPQSRVLFAFLPLLHSLYSLRSTASSTIPFCSVFLFFYIIFFLPTPRQWLLTRSNKKTTRAMLPSTRSCTALLPRREVASPPCWARVQTVRRLPSTSTSSTGTTRTQRTRLPRSERCVLDITRLLQLASY
jgi:hypothetical protein